MRFLGKIYLEAEEGSTHPLGVDEIVAEDAQSARHLLWQKYWDNLYEQTGAEVLVELEEVSCG